MPNIARTTPRPPARSKAPPPKPKILLVRQPVKSVRKSDEPDRAMLRLHVGMIVALGVPSIIWLLGFLGFRLGFAPLMRVPDLMIEPPTTGGLTTGAMMLVSIPQVILQAGIAQPMWLMLGFALIAIPAASLGAIKQISPGGPRPKPAVVFISFTGAVVGCLNALALLVWTVSSYRLSLVRELPFDPAEAVQWLDDLHIAGGLDVLGAIAASLWVVVVMRLSIPRWLRGLSASACFFALAVVAVAMAVSNATIAHVTASRPVFVSDEETPSPLPPQLALGSTPEYFASLRVDGNATLIDLRNRPARLTITRQESIIEYLRDRAPQEE